MILSALATRFMDAWCYALDRIAEHRARRRAEERARLAFVKWAARNERYWR